MSHTKLLPRVILVRHGETEWSLNGKHTGQKSDIPLTAHGEEVVRALGPRVVGAGKVLDPHSLKAIICSPMQRARRTLDLLFEGCDRKLPTIETRGDVNEWDYGDYEGLKTGEIRKKQPEWDIWTDGCPGGESAQQMSDRMDRVIARILELQQEHKGKSAEEQGECAGDILIVAHGHFTRCFLTRWCDLPLTKGRLFVCDAGALSIAGYQHGNWSERSLLGVNLHGS